MAARVGDIDFAEEDGRYVDFLRARRVARVDIFLHHLFEAS